MRHSIDLHLTFDDPAFGHDPIADMVKVPELALADPGSVNAETVLSTDRLRCSSVQRRVGARRVADFGCRVRVRIGTEAGFPRLTRQPFWGAATSGFLDQRQS